MSKHHPPLLVSVVGVDSRTKHMLQLFFRGPCKNGFVLTEGKVEAEAIIIDMDVPNAGDLYHQQKKALPEHPFILLSLTDQDGAEDFFVKKPIQTKALMAVMEGIKRARKNTGGGELTESKESDSPKMKVFQATSVNDKVGQEEEGAAHRSAMLLDEKSFSAFIGALKNIDLKSEEQVRKAHYDPKSYLQGYFQSACKIALDKNQVLQLDGSWRPLLIFPRTNEVWLDADDKQLQAACRVPLKILSGFDSEKEGTSMAISIASNLDELNLGEQNNFQNIDSFLWKVSLWTSQGRVPLGVDLEFQVYLHHWPNMTRLMLFPHAMRIAALMMDQPRSLLEIARVLDIPQQYVFAFYSAARALGIAGQVKKRVEATIALKEAEKPKKRGLFGRIMDRLRFG